MKLPWTKKTPEQVVEAKRERQAMKISEAMMERVRAMGAMSANPGDGPVRQLFDADPYLPPSWVAPANHVMAMDSAYGSVLSGIGGNGLQLFSGMGFPGFPYLTELTQITEYRDMSERVAKEMVRKFIELRSTGDADKTERIRHLEQRLKDFCVKERLLECAIKDGWFGRCQLFINLGDVEGDELKTPLMFNQYKVQKGDLRGFKVVEPITTYPAVYNSTNPLAQDYYEPKSWFVYGQQVHATRMFNFNSRPLPDLLKPVYNFSGMSLSQLAQPYVDYWLSTRDSVGRLLRNFSTSGIKTDMSSALSGDQGAEIINRAKLFNAMKTNDGLMLLDKDSEEFFQYNVPLSGLDKLQAQAQEHMAAVAKTPLVILLGISPTGLNASSEGEIRTFYSYVAEQQETLFRKPLEKILQLIQLSDWGEIDPDITFDFVSLVEMTEKELSEIRKSDADAGVQYITAGVVTPEEERKRLAADPSSGYNGLDVSKMPEPPAPPMPGPGTQPVDPNASSKAGAEMGTAPAGTDRRLRIGSDVLAMMEDCLVMDRGFKGNQFRTTGLEADSYTKAMRKSRVAHEASKRAHQFQTPSSHQAAMAKHQAALQSHKAALLDATITNAPIHEAFCQAHEAAVAAHQLGQGV